MFARIYAATTLGIDGRMIDVEVDVSPGLLGFEFVGGFHPWRNCHVFNVPYTMSIC